MSKTKSHCSVCDHHIRGLEQATELLRTIVRSAHMYSENGATIMEARLDDDAMMKLCLWDVDCEDCELSHDAEADRAEVDSQWEEFRSRERRASK